MRSARTGAVGLMQLIPATAERFGVKDSTGTGREHQRRGRLSGLAVEGIRQRSGDGAGRLQCGRGGCPTPMAACRPMPRRGTMCRSAGRLAGGARAVRQPAAAGDRPLHLPHRHCRALDEDVGPVGVLQPGCVDEGAIGDDLEAVLPCRRHQGFNQRQTPPVPPECVRTPV